jgi:hypothetical protein
MKNVFIILVILITTNIAFAQMSMVTGTGITHSPNSTKYINVGDGTVANTQVYSYDVVALSICGFLYPKYHFKQEKPGRGQKAKPYSLSVGAPILLGAQLGFGATSLTYSLYPMADINVGSCNVNTADKLFGAYAGIGFGIQNTNNLSITNFQPTNLPISSKYRTIVPDANNLVNIKGAAKNIGLAVHFGVEFPGLFYRGTKNGLRIAAQPALNKQGASYYTLCLQQSLGSFR